MFSGRRSPDLGPHSRSAHSSALKTRVLRLQPCTCPPADDREPMRFDGVEGLLQLRHTHGQIIRTATVSWSTVTLWARRLSLREPMEDQMIRLFSSAMIL